MKSLITLVGIFTFMWGTPLLAAEKLLSDQLLDTVTAGSGGDAAQQAISSTALDSQLIDPDVQNQIDNQNANALNVVSTPSVNISSTADASQNINSRNRYLIMKDGAQQNVKAVNVVNAIESQVGSGLNVHANSLRPSDLSRGSLNSLHQTNIINQNHN